MQLMSTKKALVGRYPVDFASPGPNRRSRWWCQWCNPPNCTQTSNGRSRSRPSRGTPPPRETKYKEPTPFAPRHHVLWLQPSTWSLTRAWASRDRPRARRLLMRSVVTHTRTHARCTLVRVQVSRECRRSFRDENICRLLHCCRSSQQSHLPHRRQFARLGYCAGLLIIVAGCRLLNGIFGCQ